MTEMQRYLKNSIQGMIDSRTVGRKSLARDGDVKNEGKGIGQSGKMEVTE